MQEGDCLVTLIYCGGFSDKIAISSKDSGTIVFALPMSTMDLRRFPFICHIVLEVPAALAFALFPSATLRRPQPDAHAVIRQYALSLVTTVVIAIIFGFGLHEPEVLDPYVRKLERQVAGALALYHLGPMTRATYRIWSTEGASYWTPCLHLLCHGAGGTVLVGRAFDLC